MNFSKFFITRPIFAAVLSLVLLIAGSISLFQLPISEYPEVVPPTVVYVPTSPAPTPRSSAKPSPRRWSRQLPVWKTCCTCLPSPPLTAS